MNLPWTVQEVFKDETWRVVDADGEAVATFSIACDGPDAKATAYLVAGAPKLKEAVSAVLFQVVQGPVLERDACITAARAAFIKSEAKS